MGDVVKHRLAVVDAIEQRARADGLSLRQLAERLGVSASTCSNWLRASVEPAPSRGLQLRIAAYLEVSPLEVLELFELELAAEPLVTRDVD